MKNANSVVKVISFNNVDLYYAELDSIQEDSDFSGRLEETLATLGRLVHREKLLVHLEDTPLSAGRMSRIIEAVLKIKSRVSKIAFVGIHGLTRWNFSRMLRRDKGMKEMHWKIINDYQLAKEWIVSSRL